MAQNQYPPELASQARLVADIPEFSGTTRAPGRGDRRRRRPRRSDEERVIYRLEGGTVQDLFVATWGYNWARANELRDRVIQPVRHDGSFSVHSQDASTGSHSSDSRWSGVRHRADLYVYLYRL